MKRCKYCERYGCTRPKCDTCMLYEFYQLGYGQGCIDALKKMDQLEQEEAKEAIEEVINSEEPE